METGRWRAVLRMRFLSLVKRSRVEAELDKELRFHLERQTEENIGAGMNAREAREAASRMFGGVSQVEEECRDMRRTQNLENFLQDLRYALRVLGKSPAFSVVMVLTLGLRIGANSAVFSVIDGVLLKPLPYPHAERIARVFYRSKAYAKFPVNPWDFLDFRAQNRSFENFAMYSPRSPSGFPREMRVTSAPSPLVLSDHDRRVEVSGSVLTETFRPAGLALAPHFHEHPNIALTVDGSFIETVGAEAYQAHPASVIFRPAGAEPGSELYALF